jgi:hypothetical protein
METEQKTGTISKVNSTTYYKYTVKDSSGKQYNLDKNVNAKVGNNISWTVSTHPYHSLYPETKKLTGTISKITPIIFFTYTVVDANGEKYENLDEYHLTKQNKGNVSNSKRLLKAAKNLQEVCMPGNVGCLPPLWRGGKTRRHVSMRRKTVKRN